MTDFFIKQGDRLPIVGTVLQDKDGPIDISGQGITNLKFFMRKIGSEVVKVNSNVQIIDDANGVVAYAWAEGDTDDPGIYKQQIKGTDGSGKPMSWPSDGWNRVIVVEDISA